MAFALVGEDLDLGLQERPEVDVMLDAMGCLGWTCAAIAHHVVQMRADETAWPHHVPAALRDGLGAAQFHAAVLKAREALDLEEHRVPPSGAKLTEADRRLLADVPPHHVQR